MQDQAASATASAQAAYKTLTDMVIDSWSESDLKNFCDKNGINVPQGTKVNELRALVRKNRAEILGDTVSGTAASAYGAATSYAGNEYARATDSVSKAYQDAFNEAVDTWSESRLKGYLDARGVPVPHASKKDELRALVRKHSHKAASGWNAWTFDDLSYENLKNYLTSSGDTTAQKAAKKAGATRDDLVKAAQSAYSSASKAGGTSYASATSYLAAATQAARNSVFDTWSESELKSYLDSYGVVSFFSPSVLLPKRTIATDQPRPYQPVPQGTKVNELRAYARKQATYFKYGTTTPTETVFAKISEGVKDTWEWVKDQLNMGASAAKKNAEQAKQKAKEEL